MVYVKIAVGKINSCHPVMKTEAGELNHHLTLFQIQHFQLMHYSW